MGIEEIKARLSAHFFQDHPSPWVNGIGIGWIPRRDERPETLEPPCVLVFVGASTPECELRTIRNTVTDMGGDSRCVLHTSRFVGLQATTGASFSYRAPHRYNLPLVSVGTLGAVVRAGGKRYLLGSNHVIAHNGRAKVETEVVAPGTRDATEGSVIGALSHVVKLNAPPWPLNGTTEDQANKVDCALAEVTGAIDAPTPVEVLSIGPSPTPIPVTKMGRTTLKTDSLVSVFDWDGFIDYSFGTYYFAGFLGAYDEPQTSPSGTRIVFAEPGDSGALVVNTQGQGVGLITARAYVFDDSGQFTATIILMCSLSAVRDALATPTMLGIPLAKIEFWR